jgi:hypothetical protein
LLKTYGESRFSNTSPNGNLCVQERFSSKKGGQVREGRRARAEPEQRQQQTRDQEEELIDRYRKKRGQVRERHKFVQTAEQQQQQTCDPEEKLIHRFIQEEEIVADSDWANTIA